MLQRPGPTTLTDHRVSYQGVNESRGELNACCTPACCVRPNLERAGHVSESQMMMLGIPAEIPGWLGTDRAFSAS